jgi:hypothetical protein
MATKTLIRSKKPHEVKLTEGSQVAQSPQAHAADEQQVPAMIRKNTGSRRAGASANAKPTASVAKTAPARKKASSPAEKRPAAAPARKRSSKAVPPPKAPSPRLPAKVPADGLWEADSAVMQRLQALVAHNAQLSEQLQRLQNTPVSKGYKP